MKKQFTKGLVLSLGLVMGLSVAAPAEAVMVIGNRLRYDLDQQIMMWDLMEMMDQQMQGFNYASDTLVSQTDPQIETRDNDARCNSYAKNKLAGKTWNNTTDQQKKDAATALIAMYQGATNQGGLGNAIPAGSGRPAQPNGWTSLYNGMPKDSNGFRLLQVIDETGGSWTVRLYAPGGDPNAATVTAINNIQSPTQTAPLQPIKSKCPRDA